MPATNLGLPTSVQNDAGQSMDVNFVGQSPHVFAYRFWTKAPDATTWTKAQDGNTGDALPDFFSLGPVPDGTQVAYWVGVGGKAQSVYRFSVIFTQDGAVPAGGTQTHQDSTDDEGGAVVEHEVVLI